jgi:fumarate hydratase subunit alpha
MEVLMGIDRKKFVEAASLALTVSLKKLPVDIRRALEEASRRETDPRAGEVLRVIVRNIELAEEKDFPLCQDTGTPGFILELGTNCRLEFDVYEALSEAAKKVTEEFPLIPHAVHPVTRENPGSNVGLYSPVVHALLVPGSNEVTLTAKPLSAIEAKCAVHVFDVTATEADMETFLLETVSGAGTACPPLVVGIGLGSSLDNVGFLALKATLRPLGTRNPDDSLAALESKWLGMINRLGMGAMNIGGDITALSVNIEAGLTHSVHTPMAIRSECWCNRKAAVRLSSDGSIILI